MGNMSGKKGSHNNNDGWEPPTPVQNNEELTPLEKLRKQIQRCEEKPKKNMAVLVSTGSYCPIHKMHVEIFETAKRHLEQNCDYYVVGGFLSPSHHVHVYAKVADYAIPHEDRVKMAQIAVRDSSWIEVSAWEAVQPYFVDLGAVTRQITEFIASNINSEHHVTVFYLCGADLAVRCGFHNRNGNRPMKFVGVCRPGFGERLRTEWKEYTEANPVHPLPQGECVEAPPAPERHFILVESETEDFSSTAVRDSIVKGQYDEMEKMLHPGVAEYIRKKNYFDYAEITKSLLK